jgi:hypothetical protein
MNTESRPDGLLKRPNGCKLEQIKASRYKGRSGWNDLVIRTDDADDCRLSRRYVTSSGQMILRTVSRSDGMSRRPDGWSLDSLASGHVVRTADREPKFLT